MRYMFSFLKVIVLVALIGTSIYQTGKLWFEDTSDRNFFYDVFKEEKTRITVVNPNGDIVVPEQIGVYIGSPSIEYTLIGKGAASYNSVEEAAVSAIARVLKEGTYVGRMASEKELWTKEHLLITLPFDYPREVLQEGYELDDANMGDITSISAFILVPAASTSEKMKLYAESGDSDDIYQFSISEDKVSIDNEILNYRMKDLLSVDNNAAYISTRKNNLPFYERTILLPDVRGNIRYHNGVQWAIPYVTNDQVSSEEVRQLASGFFNNPETMGMVASDQLVRFAVGNVTVSYNAQGLLTYNDATKTNVPSNLNSAIGLANDFVKMNNAAILLEYYLSDYQIEEDRITIYYSSGYNGYPIMMDQESQAKYGMSYPIEVVVTGNRVTDFKSLTRKISDILPQFDIFESPYEDALDALILQSGPFQSPIEDMYLGYHWAEPGNGLDFQWVVQLKDETYFVKTGDQ